MPHVLIVRLVQIANRIKAKGLQKLRWYCQMCQKQCRDENGFKCHLTSDSHRRQMEIFGQNPTRIISGYSEEFHDTFMEHMRRAYVLPCHIPQLASPLSTHATVLLVHLVSCRL
jgi:Domain of Kin17 curved DNA-binding protein/Zinc-finger double-stranded RNA-binding